MITASEIYNSIAERDPAITSLQDRNAQLQAAVATRDQTIAGLEAQVAALTPPPIQH